MTRKSIRELDGRCRVAKDAAVSSSSLQRLRNLRRIRLALGLTRSTLARRVGVSPALINLLERRYPPRTAALVDAIANALGVTPDVLIAPLLDIIAGRDGAIAFLPIRQQESTHA